jgi:hypothetical protein
MPESELESESERDQCIINTECNIDAVEMYLEALKLEKTDECLNGYNLGMKFVYFTKASLAYYETDNKNAFKNSVKISTKAFNEAIAYFEKKLPDHYFIKAANLAHTSLKEIT